MRILYFDCFSGIAGDMTVGALRDLGVEQKVFLEAMEAIALPEGLHAHFHRGMRQGISGWKFHVHEEHESHNHKSHSSHGSHSSHEHVHGRTYAEIRTLLENSHLSPAVKSRALAIFHRIAVAEGRIHGLPVEEVGFHEVGAVDSIADIVAACAGIESLGVDRVCSSTLVEGSGWIQCAHGQFPLPAPATLAILEGIPLTQTPENSEFITPTGAAILAEYAQNFGPMPAMKSLAIGYGLGTRETPPRPNVLRAVLGESDELQSSDHIKVLETNLDDLSPELLGAATETLLREGALDVFVTPAQMKKNRPGHLLTVLAKREDASRLARVIFRETSAFGLRIHGADRLVLDREITSIEISAGRVKVKLGRLEGTIVQATPEFESCRDLAESSGLPVREIYHAAIASSRALFGQPSSEPPKAGPSIPGE